MFIMNKREFIKLAGLAGVAALANPSGLFAAGEQNKELLAAKAPFELPPLPYAVGALEPHIDQLTMEIHHGKHHAAYVKNLNDALKASPLAAKSLGQIMAGIKPTDTAIRNNGGGHYNHSFFWSILSPTKSEPSAKLKSAITAAFGSDEAFRTQFADAAKGVFGSGWAWLIVKKDGKLAITSTPNQDNPLMTNIAKVQGTPILGLDVWEHAYYLKHQNKRPDYISAFWNVVNWEKVSALYEEALKK